jgi:hypothetical protein
MFYSEQFYSNDFKWMMIGGYGGYPYDFGARSICRWFSQRVPRPTFSTSSDSSIICRSSNPSPYSPSTPGFFGAEAALVLQAETCRDMEMKNHQQGWKMDLKTLMDMGIR